MNTNLPQESSSADPFDENIRAVARIQEKTAEQRTAVQRISDRISAFASQESMIAVHLVWFGLWIGINVGASRWKFDPFPFSLLTTIVSLEAIFLTFLILASQNRLTRQAEHRAHLDLQVNLLSEQEMTMVLKMLREICAHMNLHETIESPQFAAFVKRTDVAQLADHLQRTIDQPNPNG